LGIKYNKWVFESSLCKSGKADKVLNSLKNKKLIYEKDGALWFRSKKFGDNRDRVLIKSNGEKTYLGRDIPYHYNKFKERKFDKVINIWGADHHGNVSGLLAGAEAIGYKGKLDIIIHQFVTISEKGKRVRMSKRRGTFVTLEELLNMVGSDVVRFFFLMYSADRHMDFDLTLAKEKSEKNPVYYIQYAYARINSILKKSKSKVLNPKFNLLSHPSELGLIKELIKLPEIIEDTVKDYQVQRLPHYALDVATAFHKFYTDCKVLGDYKDMEKARLSLVLATKIVLENILDLMGISKPKKM
jgi:arginyl-tRNA synthetase